MGRLFAHNQDLLIHLTVEDIHELIVAQVEGGGRNFYAVYDVIHNNNIAIPESLALQVIDKIKEGKICDIKHSFFKDKQLNF